MDSVMADPPDSYLTDSYTFCEWAARVMVEVRPSEAAKVAMTLPALTTLMARLRQHVAIATSKSSVELIHGLDEMDTAIKSADIYDTTIVIPSEPFLNLAHRVMKYANN